MSEKSQTHIIVIRESVWQSLATYLGTLALFVSLIGIGIVLDSSALQWIGAIIGFLTILSRAASKAKKLTKEQALRFIQELDA